MEFIRDLEQLKIEKRSAVTLGKFDGLHRGHRLLLNQVLAKKKEGDVAAIFTFDAPPSRLLNGRTSGVILTNEERRALAEKIHIDVLVQCPFTKDIASMEPEEFVKKILIDKMNVGFIVVGTDFHFGHDRKGNIGLLAELSKKYGYKFIVVPKEQYHGRDISSSYIREVLRTGDVTMAHHLLGYPYFISGEVVKGKQLGRTLGIPTANQIPDREKLLPPNGVYASKVKLDGVCYFGMTNIGIRPTVENTEQKNVETFLFDYEGNLYGKNITVQLLQHERPEQCFDSVERLKEQLYSDIVTTKRILNL